MQLAVAYLQSYALIHTYLLPSAKNPEGNAMDMTANVENVLNILRAELGKVRARPPVWRHWVGP